MKNRKKWKMIYIGILLWIPLMFSSCLNYIPCRGQDYIIENITHRELINKFNEFREKHPEYIFSEDHIDKNIPWRIYLELYWKDLDLRVHLNIHIGDKIPNPPTHLKFTHIGDRDVIWSKDINSKELDEKLNEQYKEKFEKEILDKLGVKWRREKCW